MLIHLLGTRLDQRTQSLQQKPAYQILLFSRWLDTDSDIVRGTYTQTPMDITEWVESANISLNMETDASSLSLNVVAEKIPLGVFYNAIVQVREGDEMVDPAQWPTTFTGWRVGQPGSTESLRPGQNLTPEEGRGKRGEMRTLAVNFVSRERQFSDFEITSEGVWLPNIRPNPAGNSPRNNYDDVGLIAKEIATDADWGMGLQADEVQLGPLPYRIEKQLQFVQIAVWEALQQLLQVLHMVPGVNGEGRVVARDRSLTKPVARRYRGTHLISISQSDAQYTQINAIIVKGLAKDLTEVRKQDQKLVKLQGTFGFFDPHMQFEAAWGGDEQETYRVKVGTVADGNGNTRTSPRIRKFSTDGFITSVSTPDITLATEFNYKVEIENDTLLVVGLLAAVFSGYVAAMILAEVFTPFETGAPGGQTVVNPGAIVAQTAASLLLLGGLYVLQQISNFEFELWGIPFETVYEEIRSDAILAQFSQISGGQPFREWERKDVEIKNYIFSTIADSVVPAAGTEPQVTNPGIERWSREELAIQLAQQAVRQVEMVRDLLLEPADIIEDEDTGFRYFVKSITRELRRGDSPSMQTAECFRIP